MPKLSTSQALRPAPVGGVTVIKRDYWNEEGTHRPYRNHMHTAKAEVVDHFDVLNALLDQVPDGEEVHLIAVRTGRQMCRGRRYRYQAPHTYGTETLPQYRARIKAERQGLGVKHVGKLKL